MHKKIILLSVFVFIVVIYILSEKSDAYSNTVYINSLPYTISEGDTLYILNVDAINYTATAITVEVGVTDICIDLNGHILDGTDASGVYGIMCYGDYVIIKNGTIQDWNNGIRFSNCLYYVVENVNITSCYYGVYSSYCHNSIIRNVNFSFNSEGMRVETTQYMDVYNNTFYNNSNGIRWRSSTNYGKIHDNLIIGPNAGNGILIEYNCMYNKVFNNTIRRCANGIYFYSYAKYSEIYDNYIEDMLYMGIRIESSSYNYIHDNTIKDCGDYGISTLSTISRHNNISYNYIYGCIDAGIEVRGLYDEIYMNGIYACNNNGIMIDSTPSGTIINKNYIQSCLRGIFIYYADNITIKNNFIKLNNYGISSRDSQYCWIYNNEIINNGYNIYLFLNTENHTFHTNYINDSIQYGIYIITGSDNNTFYNNYVRNWRNIYIDTTTVNNKFNTTKTVGKNIIGGIYIGGNYWSDYTGVDADGDGIGDTPYGIYSYYDYLPLVNYTYPNATVSLSEGWNGFTVSLNNPNETVEFNEIKVRYNNVTYTWDDAVNNNIISGNVYEFVSSGFVPASNISSGRGYNIYSFHDNVILIIPGYIPVTTDDYMFECNSGWNFIGNPYNETISKDNVTIIWNGTEYNWTDAVNNNIISNNIYESSAGLVIITDSFKPNTGTWVYAFKDGVKFRRK